MAGKQVITIDPCGDMRGLDHKRKGLDLRQFGKAKTQRATLIEWDDLAQDWFIKFPPPEGGGWTRMEFKRAGVGFTQFNGYALTERFDSLIHFAEYEDAVSAEVAVIQALQLKGDTLGLFP
jgi:hypothetical protein